MSLASRAKHRSTRFLTCSGSRVSDRAVKPTRSPKTTVTTRRSSATAWMACPQVGQNRAPSGTVAEHDGHVTEELYDGMRRGPSSDPHPVRSGAAVGLGSEHGADPQSVRRDHGS